MAKPPARSYGSAVAEPDRAMISAFRRYLDTWVVRLLFVVLVLSFAVWGVGDVVRNLGRDTAAARVGGRSIEVPEVQEAFQRQLAQVSRMMRDKMEPTPEIRRMVLNQTVDRLVTQAAIMQEAQRLGIVVPDDEVRRTVYEIPAFRGPNGHFDMNTFQGALRNAGLTEPRFLAMARADLANRQLMEAVRAGVEPPDTLTRAVVEFQGEKRSADMVELPFATAPRPEPPAEAALQRFWENHPDLYSTPEYRRVKIVILSPQTVAKDIEVSPEDLRAAYDQHKAEYVTPPKRSAQVVTAPDQARAAALAAEWRRGADWERMQLAAKEAGGTAVALDDATREEFPSPELGTAVFDAAPESVSDPVKSPFGWDVVRVLKVTPGSDRSFEEAREALRDRVVAERAADLLYERANKLDNLLASGTGLDQLANDLGLAAMTGTLDARGQTMDGQPVPIPGPTELRDAIVQAAFQTPKGEPPRLTEVQTPPSGGSAYYAETVEDIVPSARKPFETVRDQVLADWTKDAVRHAREQEAAKLLADVKGGQSLQDAATVAGLTVRRTPLTGRTEPSEGVPAQLVGPLFRMAPGEPTMVETPDGFVVAVAGEIERPDPASDPAGFARAREGLARAMGDDAELVFASALRDRANPRVNQRVLDTIVPP
jgi:peptidyl-prolyl cis-trans isomerase D